jgi:hypothetical protein
VTARAEMASGGGELADRGEVVIRGPPWA